MFDGIDKLEHALANVFGLARSATDTDGFVEVAIGTILEDKVDVVFGLEVMDEVNDVRMISDPAMDCEFLGAIVHRQGRWAVGNSRRLGQTLQSNKIGRPGVIRLEDHPKGAMVERSQSSEPSI